MLAFKFLLDGAIGPFSQHRWPRPEGGGPGPWVAAPRSLRRCVEGIHACAAEDLSYWLASEMWIIELGGEIVREEKKLIAPRGRLLRRVEGWTPDRAREFSGACVLRACGVVAGMLRDAGEKAVAGELAACRDAAGLASRLAAIAQEGPLANAIGYLEETIEPLEADNTGLCAYIAAQVPLTQEGYLRERAWQSRWLVEHLDLERAVA